MKCLAADTIPDDPDAIYRELARLSEVERRFFRRYFSRTMHSLSHAAMYWSPSKRRILARSPAATRRFVLPADAILIGAYAHPFSGDDFLGDLDDVLAKIATKSAYPSTGGHRANPERLAR